MATPADARLAVAPPFDEMEQARAGLYRLLGAALSHPPTPQLLEAIGGLHGQDTGTAVGAALAALVQAAKATTLDAAAQDYDTIFVGIARGELVPYASFYLTGFLHDRPLARLRQELVALGFAATPGHPDPEDHAGTLCELMGELIAGGQAGTQALDLQRRFFKRHMAPWIGQFFSDLEVFKSSVFYSSVGLLGGSFFDVECLAFEMEA